MIDVDTESSTICTNNVFQASLTESVLPGNFGPANYSNANRHGGLGMGASKKKALKGEVHQAVMDWVEDFEVQTSTTKTRVLLAGLLALASRVESERRLLLSVAAMVDKGIENWAGGVNGLGVKDGLVVESHSLARAALIPQPLQEPRKVKHPGESGAATHPRGFEIPDEKTQVKNASAALREAQRLVAGQARKRSKKA
jgi:hypothetical protein